MFDSCQSGILGLCIGDAVGVPVEFTPRKTLQTTPVCGMQGGGNAGKPAGTWSDDSALTLATLDSLAEGGDTDNCMQKFTAWLKEGKYTSDGDVFDVGNTTRNAIINHVPGKSLSENGNGSLMRILPVAYVLFAKYGDGALKTPEAFETIHQYSALTHAHPISKMTCGIYCCVVWELLCGLSKTEAVDEGASAAARYYHASPEFQPWYQYFSRIFNRIIGSLSEAGIRSGGFAVDTLEAALWVLLKNETYESTILAAVNLGDDTDTTASVAGSLAGIYYGEKSIPKVWIDTLKGKELIYSLCAKFDSAII